MDTRALGGLRVAAIGLGVMGMSEFYGAPDEAENEATLARAVELGVTFWDTADAVEQAVMREAGREPRVRAAGHRILGHSERRREAADVDRELARFDEREHGDAADSVLQRELRQRRHVRRERHHLVFALEAGE